MQNKHISQFLNYYIELSNPQYAVFLKGKWGSGKTHFINEYKNELNKNKQKYIYVSLYGVTSYDEIETKFLEAIYPRLYNKKTIFAGKIAKQLLKATLKIDWDADGKADGSVNIQIPNFKPEDLLNTRDYILIFDDLERCSINIINLLGYINFFVEHQSYKVILIANEEELEKTEKYTQIKEKLIGKTFEFISDANSAYDSFLGELENENKIKENILEKQKSNILELFEKSQSNNLRALRQTLLDFERFYDKVLVNHQAKEELIKDILYWFFLFSFEIKQGNNDILDLQKFSEEYYSYISKQNSEKAIQTKYIYFNNKYKFKDNYFDVVISFNLWKEVLLNSNIKKEDINLELRNSKYYFDESTPSWKKLSSYYNLEDKEFEELLEDVYKEFCKNNYKEYKQFKLITSMLLFFQENSLLDVELEKLTDLTKKNFQHLFDKGIFNFKDIYSNNDRLFTDKHYYNIGYFEGENFNIISDFINNFLKEKELETLKDDTKLIIEYIEKKDGKSIFNLLEGYNNIYKFDYKNRPILEYIEVDDLFNALLKTNGTTMYYLGGTIKDRYILGKNELLCEKKFLEELLNKIDNYLKDNKYKLSSYNLEKEIKENILIALDEIKKRERLGETN
ncbi:P-loop NTPase fold protein [Aliarcobacter butzleri]|uniref:P-loop NTPase fold protein n=3 Tax=Aliarcobacter butzleri TaxID=28197 RepID=A0AAW7PQM3_9BACT|nr:P-loop NTPase fold protein [Aliarcobacter butzleri]MCT7638291.1 P-loop NTPase fold protein [Aliarcobacter butzleri]MDN5063471.1 P-loop NTPase fold protein [Aliarcobacter butzleri]MDN5066256.1 P-loop NTPase fold protein [Aliarcobacter butzleri]MDN5125220.1 P-loop NTPase fold protein [Aliarcobacter butzleri]